MDFGKIGEYGVTVVSVVVLFFVIKMILEISKTTSKATNSVVQANTKAINQLTLMIERSHVVEEQFREDMKDVRGMVHDIHKKVVQ